jgi:hypothetical protein
MGVGCATIEATPAARVDLTPAQVEAVHEGFRAVMKDPDSARFGALVAAAKPDGTLHVCGSANGKNSFGGFTGMQPFMGILSNGPTTQPKPTFAVSGIGSNGDMAWVVRMHCRRHGLTV